MDGTVKLAMNAKPMNDKIQKSQHQIRDLLELLDSGVQFNTSKKSGDVWFTYFDLKYAFSQVNLSDEASSHCNFDIVWVEHTGIYRHRHKVPKCNGQYATRTIRSFLFLGCSSYSFQRLSN